LVLVVVAPAPLRAVRITLDNLLSTVNATDGECSLREAITAANTDSASGSVLGECPAGSGPDRILIGGQVDLTAVDNTVEGPNGLPAITSTITIEGNGYPIVRDPSAPLFRIFAVAPSGDLTLKNATVVYGEVESFRSGGCLFNSHGKLTLIGSHVENCTAGQSGGGILNDGHLILVDSSVLGNKADAGGGIANQASATINRSTIFANTATTNNGIGGGFANSGQLEMVNSTLSGNSAKQGGGLNTHNEGTSDLYHVTIADNSASVDGGGLDTMENGDFFLSDTILGHNTGGNCAAGISLLSGGGNFADDSSCGSPIPATLTGLDVNLEDNGGPTRTHALLDVFPESVAIDGALNCGKSWVLAAGPIFLDQRNGLRDETTCDSGAFEYGADDRYELSGSTGDDDSCRGHHILFEEAERHLHTIDEDWVRFIPWRGDANAKYVIETKNLIGGADTVLELWDSVCTAAILSDDDGGSEPLASKIIYTVAPGDELLHVRVTEWDDYQVGEGYDLSVTCIENCPSCQANGGPDIHVMIGDRVFSRREIESCGAILAYDATVEPKGELILRAASSVNFDDGFEVAEDGTLIVEIDPEL
jgi:CSLREA domain-containing protein